MKYNSMLSLKEFWPARLKLIILPVGFAGFALILDTISLAIIWERI